MNTGEAGPVSDASQVQTSEGVSTQGGPSEGPGTPAQNDPGYVPDSSVPDRSGQIMEAFGLDGDWAGEMSRVDANLSSNAKTGGTEVPPPVAAPAAEGGQAAHPASEPSATPSPQPAGTTPTPQPAAPQAPAGGPVPAAPSAPVSGDAARIQQLEAMVTSLQQLVTQPPQQSAQPQGQSGAPPAQMEGELPPVEQLTRYDLRLPADVLQAIGSEDEGQRAAGLYHLVNSLASSVHARAVAHATHIIRGEMAGYQQQTAAQQRNQQILNDYYSHFSDHAGFQPVVAAEASAMWNENPALQWDENARNALGARVNARLGIGGGAPQQTNGNGNAAPIVAPSAPAPAGPAPMLGTGTRPSSGEPSGGEQITSILNAFNA